MADQIHLSAPSAFADAADRPLAGRLIDQLKLQFCSVLQEPQSIMLKTVSIGRSNLVFIENSSELNLKARIGAATSVMWQTLKGTARLHVGQDRITCRSGTGCTWPSSADVRIETTGDHSALAVRIDHACLEHELSRLLGRPIRASLAFNPSPTVIKHDSALGLLLHFISDASTSTNSGFIKSGILSAATETLLLDTLLATQPSNYSAALNALHTVAVPRHLRAAMRAVKTSRERPWRLSEMAEEGGVSVRTICESFQKFCACTPKQFVHREELAQMSKATSIAQVARRCGFHHPGRFAATYHRVYGESPSETVHRMAEPVPRAELDARPTLD